MVVVVCVALRQTSEQSLASTMCVTPKNAWAMHSDAALRRWTVAMAAVAFEASAAVCRACDVATSHLWKSTATFAGESAQSRVRVCVSVHAPPGYPRCYVRGVWGVCCRGASGWQGGRIGSCSLRAAWLWPHVPLSLH